jgi:uncharacterized protein YndB with AHSA1/START domain
MPLPSSDTQLAPCPLSHPLEIGPLLDRAPLAADSTEPTLRIRARRLYTVPRGDLYAAWTRRTAWESWMRLRARSRTTLSPRRGGDFRLELAEGATIHVITGSINDIRAGELLSLSWLHHTKSERSSMVDVTFRGRQGMTELTLAHSGITSRREAAWLMRLWSEALDRLASYLHDGSSAHAMSA